MTKIIVTENDRETAEVGRALGEAAEPGDVIALIGDLGAGKTTLTKGIAQGLGINPHDVTSPTFALVAEYRDGRIPLHHLDVYRLNSSADLMDIGFDDILHHGDSVVVIEWADRVADALPDGTLTIKIAIDANNDRADARALELTGGGASASRLIDQLNVEATHRA
jgi:tRNA threonylcarbamoyladenosine biosynthesis protein TsaE